MDASGLNTLDHLMTASIASGTGSDSATAAKATAGGQEMAARAAAAKTKDDGSSSSTSSTTTMSTSTSTSAATDDDSVANDDDDDSSGGKKATSSHSTSKAKASPPPNLSANVTQTDESPADWYDDDGSATMGAGDQAEAPASAGSTSGSAVGTADTGSGSASGSGSSSGTAKTSNTTLPNGRAHLDENNPHRAEMKRNNPKGDHTSTNDDDDVGYIHYNGTSNEDYVVGDDDDAPKTVADAIVSNLSKKSKTMSMSTREGYVAAFVALVVAAGFGIYVATKHCRRTMKEQRRRSGYQTIE